ncbi:hypothetical protein Flavo103_22700 [Flavobacterium collinsii]|nr:rSAM-modified peptide [Flavobacterium collinsii]GIQ59134.1 hypothetical protein Flavo103_22700 [Flavobacterium collinsii]
MTNQAQKLEDFQLEKLSNKEQKTIQGGDESNVLSDTIRGNGKGSN